MSSADVVVVGAGLIGLASARALRRRGCRVTVVEKGPFARHAASRAAAGMLGAQLQGHGDDRILELCVQSREMYPAWVEELTAITGVDVGFRRTGSMQVAYGSERLGRIEEEVRRQQALGLDARLLDPGELRALEPELSSAVTGAALFGGDGLVDPPALLEACRRAAEHDGVSFRIGEPVRALLADGERVRGVGVGQDRLEASHVVVTAGSWSSAIDGIGWREDAIEPVRGQILELRVPTQWLARPVDGPVAYLSPRPDGRILVGSTMERVGFDEGVTAEAAATLLAGAVEMAPALATAKLSDFWSGFRPAAVDRRPVLGAGALEGLVLATGHLRDGVVLAPLTAAVVEALVMGEEPGIDLRPFDPGRLAAPGGAATRRGVGAAGGSAASS